MFIIINLYFKLLVINVKQVFSVMVAPCLFCRTGDRRENYGRGVEGGKDITAEAGLLCAGKVHDYVKFSFRPAIWFN